MNRALTKGKQSKWFGIAKLFLPFGFFEGKGGQNGNVQGDLTASLRSTEFEARKNGGGGSAEATLFGDVAQEVFGLDLSLETPNSVRAKAASTKTFSSNS